MPETPTLKLPYPVGTADAFPPDDFKALAEAVEAQLLDIPVGNLANGTSGQLIIVQGTGEAAYKAMSGDATISSSGALTIGGEKVGTSKIAKEGVTGDKLAPDSVGASKIISGGVGESELADGVGTSRKLKPTIGRKTATEKKALTEGYIDIPGTTLELTPAVASTLIIDVYCLFDLDAGFPAAITGAQGCINVDNVDLDSEEIAALTATKMPEAQGVEASVCAHYAVPLSAAAHTIKLRAKKFGTKTVEILNKRSGYRYMLVAA